MRENALELAKNPMAGDRVSLEFLKADLYRRAEALKDLPDAPLFFGRLDYSELASQDEDFAGADFHIGRRHVHDPDGTPVVLDWRAPVSMPFYRASQPDPMGLTLRRRFGFAGGALTAYEDERFKSSDSRQPPRTVRTKRTAPRQQPADQRDRAPEIRPDARHRRDHPARAGRHRPGGRGDHRVRAGRARHRQDRGRPAPGRVPPLRAQGAGDQARGRRRGPEPRLPLLHQERPARTRRARRHPDHRGRPGGDHPHPRHRHRRGGHPQGRPADGRAAAATSSGRRSSRPRRRWCSAGAPAGCGSPRTRSRSSRGSCATAASATAPAANCSRTGSRT